MRFVRALCLSLVLPFTACADSSTSSADELATHSENSVRIAQPEAPVLKTAQVERIKPVSDRPSIGTPTQLPRTGPPPILCKGIAKQGGLLLCQTEPNAKVKIGRSEDDFYFETADAQGRLIVGFDRDETKTFLEYAGERLTLDFEPREYDTSRINGLPKNMVSEYSKAELARIRKASARKKVGFASRAEDIGFKDGFIFPIQAEYIKTTNFGAQRILNNIPKKPHYGVDLAAPKGTPIVAPADGIVSLADDDMYFEGSLIMIDHGQGLISYYLHNDTVLVVDGQRVTQGEQIATVGSKGRSTGPHLCWRLKWRNRNLDPELITDWPHAP